MADTLDIANLEDDELDAIIAQAEAEQVDEVTHNEDTDLVPEAPIGSIDGTEPKQDDDEIPVDTEADDAGIADDGLEENTPVEDSNLEVDEDGEPITPVDADDAPKDEEDTKDVDEDGKDTEPKNDGDEADTTAIDYKKQYEELLEGNKQLQGFYDEVTSEFTANGKKMKGFTDPKKIIQSQQMAAGFSEKMSSFKPYRPFMNAIKENGWLEDQSKFDMAVNVMNGDKEAIKALIKTNGIDVLDMDMDNINYEGTQHTKSNVSLVLDDVMTSAKASGVDEELKEVLGGQWSDDGSLVEILDDPAEAQALVNHMVKDSDGTSAYTDIQARVAEKLRTDYSGSFTSKNSLAQYKEAAKELEGEYNESAKQAKLEDLKQAQIAKAEKVEAERTKIEEQRKQREYAAKVEQETKKADDARKKAASMSKPKPTVVAQTKKFDPLKLNDDELDDFLLTLD